jgi:hypothetical protein
MINDANEHLTSIEEDWAKCDLAWLYYSFVYPEAGEKQETTLDLSIGLLMEVTAS